MVTGIVPFGGDSSADVIAAIVKTNPDQLTLRAPDTPAKLEDIILKALEKDREERYQTVKDLLVDLRKLKKRLDFETETERSFTPDREHLSKSSSATITSAGSPASSVDSVRPTSSAEYLISEIKRHKTGIVLLAIGIPVILGVAGFFLIKFLRKDEPVSTPLMKITKLTSGGRVNGLEIDGSTSISQDAKYVVYTLLDAGKVSIWVRQISTGSDVQIVPPSDLRNGGTTISNDGEFVYYIGLNAENPNGSLFRVPLLGGGSRKILVGVRSPVAFSPDGNQFAFIRQRENGESALMIANTDGTSERTLSLRKGNEWFSVNGPAWSPDGKSIAVVIGTDTGGTSMTVAGYSVIDGSQRSLFQAKSFSEPRRILWLKDGSGFITPIQHRAQGTQLWFISQPDGNASRITNDLNGYGSVSFGVSGDGKTIVTVQSSPDYQIWTTNLGTTGPSVQITHGEIDGFDGVDWTSDGQVVYFTRTGESVDLVAVNADGSGMRTILRDAKQLMADPSVSPDGKTVYFMSMRSGGPHIWRVQMDGTELKQLTSGDFADFSPQVSPDGEWVLFTSMRSGGPSIWKVSSEGGEAVQITSGTTQSAAFSPDGRMIGVTQAVMGATPVWQLGTVSNDGSTQTKLIIPPTHFNMRQRIGWTSDSRALLVMSHQNGAGNIWSQPIDGSNPKQITNFNSDLISSFAPSRDGKRLAVSRGTANLDLVLIKDFH